MTDIFASEIAAVYLLFAVFAVGILVYRYSKWKKFVNAVNRIPGADELPIFGNALELLLHGPEYDIDFMFARIKDFEASFAVTRIWIGPFPLVNIIRASSAEVILSSSRFVDKAQEYRFLHSWLGTGLLTSSGSKWHRRRKLLTNAFHFKILEDFLIVFYDQSKVLVEKLNEVSKEGQVFDVFPYITLCTLDIICDSAMGKNVGAQNHADSPYVQAVYKMSKVVMARQNRPWLRPDWLYRLSPQYREEKRCLEILHRFTDSVIRERKANLAAKGEPKRGVAKGKRLAFLDLLLEASDDGNVLSHEDIREEVDTFMFEGHDTTSAGIGWCLWLLGLHPKIQQRVYEEVDAVFGKEDRPATMDDLAQLKFLECAIKEAQRLYPSVPFIGRDLKEDVEIDGVVIPKGVTVLIIIIAIQRDPEIFPDPDKFIPERFLPENVKNRNPFAFVPFSAGPRNCIGQKFAVMEEKVIISSILRKFRIESVDNIDRMTFLPELILRSKHGIRVKLEPRK